MVVASGGSRIRTKSREQHHADLFLVIPAACKCGRSPPLLHPSKISAAMPRRLHCARAALITHFFCAVVISVRGLFSFGSTSSYSLTVSTSSRLPQNPLAFPRSSASASSCALNGTNTETRLGRECQLNQTKIQKKKQKMTIRKVS